MRKLLRIAFLQNPNSLYKKSELQNLVERMDQNNFNFSSSEIAKMIKQWKFCVSECPLPTKIKSTYYESNDAFSMNSLEVADVTFKLPYGLAFEDTNKHEYQFLVDAVLKDRIACEDKIILDAGCGFGGLLNCIKDNFPSATFMGIECTPAAKKLLHQLHPWIQLFICNIEADTATFQKQMPCQADVILCTAVLEHLRQPAQAVKNLISIKAKKGSLVLVVPNGRLDQAGQHIHFWSPESWKLFVEDIAAGYRVHFPPLNANIPSIGYNLCAVIEDL